MWFVVSTGKNKEKAARNFLLTKVKGVKEVYITPYRRTEIVDEYGRRTETVAPLLMSYVFANVKVSRRLSSTFTGLKTDKGERQMVFRQLSQSLSKGGYFRYSIRVNDPTTGESVQKYVLTNYHLLCADPMNTPVEQIMRQSWVPDTVMDAFMVFNDQTVSSSDQLRIETDSYADLIKEHDIVRVVRGQFAGQEGVVRRVPGRKRDRRLFIEFNNSLCFSISGIHQNDIVIVHEATKGKSAKEVSLWRDIDAVIGWLQFNGHPDDAPSILRRLLRDYGAAGKDAEVKGSTDAERIRSAKEAERKETAGRRAVLSEVDKSVLKPFKALGDFFSSEADTSDRVLREYIPNSLIRPFLTPPIAVSSFGDKGYVTVRHKGFVEYVVRRNLSGYFWTGTYDNNRYAPVFDEDYEYDAHVAVIDNNGVKKAVAPWGGFYDRFANLSRPQLGELAETLRKRNYPKTLDLLGLNPDGKHATCVFERVGGIGGFSRVIGDNDVLSVVQSLVDEAVPSAVEIWQGTRLQEWRQLLQRYVLLHKVPISDLPNVITDNPELDAVFSLQDADGNPDLTSIADHLAAIRTTIAESIRRGEPFNAVSLFLQVAKNVGLLFIDKEIYNNVNDGGYILDPVCTRMYEAVRTDIHDDSVLRYLDKGLDELSQMDSYRYFHIPSFLKHPQ